MKKLLLISALILSAIASNAQTDIIVPGTSGNVVMHFPAKIAPPPKSVSGCGCTLQDVIANDNLTHLSFVISDGVNEVAYRYDGMDGLTTTGDPNFFLGLEGGSTPVLMLANPATHQISALLAGPATMGVGIILPSHSGTLVTNDGGSWSGTIAGTTITIPHGLSYTPSQVWIQSRTFLPAGCQYEYNVDATNIYVYFNMTVTGVYNFQWHAFP